MFTFITSNPEKIYFAHQSLSVFGIDFETQDLKLTEIQADNPDTIITDKAAKAFAKLQTPILVSDHWWNIPALNGFPGPYMHYVNEHLTAQDLLNLMHDKIDRQAILTETIAYQDSANFKIFSQNLEGEILLQKEGKGLPGQEIITLNSDKHSIAWHLNQGTKPATKPREVFIELAKWLKQKISAPSKT